VGQCCELYDRGEWTSYLEVEDGCSSEEGFPSVCVAVSLLSEESWSSETFPELHYDKELSMTKQDKMATL